MPPKDVRNYPAKFLGDRDWLLTKMRAKKPRSGRVGARILEKRR
jgi:hypothetical protein